MSTVYSSTVGETAQARFAESRGPITFGEWYVLSVPAVAGFMALIDGVRVAGLYLSGWIWFIYLALGMLLLLAWPTVRRPQPITLPWGLWMVWLLVLAFSVVWNGEVGARNVQDALQIGMPILVGILCSAFVRTVRQLERLRTSFIVCLGCLLLSEFCFHFDLLPRNSDQGNRVAALTATLAGVVLVAGFPARTFVPLACWGAAMLFTVITGSRMATGALLIVPLLHPLVRQVWVRVMLLGALVLLALLVFQLPVIQERFFASGSGDLGDLSRGDYLDFGRLDAWPLIWEEALRRPLAGWGVGSSYRFVPLVWPNMYLVHNDYLRILFETGVVGLGVFLASVGKQVMDLAYRIRHSRGVVQEAFAAAFLGWLAFLIAAATDNPLVYNVWFMNPLFAVMGCAYGAARGEASFVVPVEDRTPLDETPWRHAVRHGHRDKETRR